MNTTIKKNAAAYIKEFFSYKFECEHERIDFERFKAAMPEGIENLKAIYEKYSGQSATYQVENERRYSKRQIEDMQDKALEMLDKLSSDPTSFTDLYDYRNRWNERMRPDYISNEVGVSIIRKCFCQMAEKGLIGVVEVKTCGRVAIRLFYSK